MSAQVAADLRAAAEVLRRDGWTRLDSEDDQGRCCMIGALIKVSTGLREDAAYDYLLGYVSDTFGIRGLSIWNDFHAKDADEVIAALEAAADAAEAQSRESQ